jgi:dienelactone hydrolase
MPDTFLRSLLFPTIPALTAALFGRPTHDTEETLSFGSLDVTIWRPTNATTPAPIVIFSHGFHGSAVQSRFLMTALAGAGYLVVAPNHADATSHGGRAQWTDHPERPFGDPEAWDESTFHGRADDIIRLIDAFKAAPAWRGQIDWDRCGLAGHSLGGYTVLGLGGAWPGWRIHGIKAILALSPYVHPFLLHRTLDGLTAPVMYQGSTLDFSITPWVGKPGGAYDLSPAPKYFVELNWAGHFAWTNLRAIDHTAIEAYSLAFFDRYLCSNVAAAPLTAPTQAVASLRCAP